MDPTNKTKSKTKTKSKSKTKQTKSTVSVNRSLLESILTYSSCTVSILQK